MIRTKTRKSAFVLCFFIMFSPSLNCLVVSGRFSRGHQQPDKTCLEVNINETKEQEKDEEGNLLNVYNVAIIFESGNNVLSCYCQVDQSDTQWILNWKNFRLLPRPSFLQDLIESSGSYVKS